MKKKCFKRTCTEKYVWLEYLILIKTVSGGRFGLFAEKTTIAQNSLVCNHMQFTPTLVYLQVSMCQ